MKILVGSDETLKGDTFGGLVVAGVALSQKQIDILHSLGVTDSKKITDIKIRKLAPLIIANSLAYDIQNVYPQEYNTKTLTKLLNDLHKTVATNIAKTLNTQITHVVDKYPGCTTGDIIIEKAESHYIQVAAASILARDVALEQLDVLSQQIGFLIPKGSTHVQEALEKLKESQKDPSFFVKMHFKNVKKALSH